MGKTKIRRKPKASPKSTAARKKDISKRRMVMLALFAGIVIFGGWWWNENRKAESLFLDNVQQGQSAIGRVERHAEVTSGHLAPGERVDYGADTPTSGRHDPRWVTPGVYDTVQSPAMLVHSLEHGMVVIYYDRPAADAMATLEDWSGLYGGPFSGLVVTSRPGLGEKLVLTAWRKSLTLERFDGPAAAAFIDAYRGRGPENPVR